MNPAMGKALGPGGRLVISMAATLLLVASAWGRDLAVDPSDTPQRARWNSVVPLPVSALEAAEDWSLGTVVTVGWGPVRGTERETLSNRLTKILAPLGRTWKPASDGAQLAFSDQGGSGEGYSLTVSPRGAVIGSSDPAGRFYGLITLTQLLPTGARPGEAVMAAGGTVDDRPAFSWRGLMLDSSRHFQSVETLEWVLELMALHKLNRFHWHLTDDQGWRLEVPGWPKLTEVGAWRTEDGHRVGGWYSAADVRRVVDFAARRHIVVVPEVDLPGHASAALAAYPELSALGTPRDVPTDWGVSDGVVSLGRASVRRFTGDVLATLTGLFPGPWIHWGGDEVYRSPWLKNPESLEWMRRRGLVSAPQAVAAFWKDLADQTVAAGRIPIGWDEVAAFGLPPQAVVQWWDNADRALTALRAGHPLISSWKETSYLDYPETGGDGGRAFWMPLHPVDRTSQHPLWPPGTPDELRPLVGGLEAGLWTERAPEPRLGVKLFPRLAVLAELAWRGVPGDVPGWEGRLSQHRERLEAWGVGMASAVR